MKDTRRRGRGSRREEEDGKGDVQRPFLNTYPLRDVEFLGSEEFKSEYMERFWLFEGGRREVRGEDERRRKKRKEKKKKRGEVNRVWVDEDVKSFLFFLHSVLVIDHHLPTNKMPLFSNTAISVFDEKFPGSGLVFDSLSLDIRCYKTVQVLEREASNSSPSQFLSLTLPLLLSFPSNKSPNNTLPSRPSQIYPHNRNHSPNRPTSQNLPQRL